jgi:hypothetical protein
MVLFNCQIKKIVIRFFLFVAQEIAAAYRIIAHVNSIDGTIKVEAPGIQGWQLHFMSEKTMRDLALFRSYFSCGRPFKSA